MAATIPVETESGSYSGRVHPHKGYYAGDFATTRSTLRASGSGARMGSTPQATAQG